MPRFGQRSILQLNTCHPDLKYILEVAIEIYDFSVICGHRGKEEQNIAFTSGKSKLEFPKSKHNKSPSMAADLAPWPIDWKEYSRFRLLAGHIIGIAHVLYCKGSIKHKIRWGGDWDSDKDMDDQKFKDLPHFELIKPT